jgi:hypothetical protein
MLCSLVSELFPSFPVVIAATELSGGWFWGTRAHLHHEVVFWVHEQTSTSWWLVVVSSPFMVTWQDNSEHPWMTIFTSCVVSFLFGFMIKRSRRLLHLAWLCLEGWWNVVCITFSVVFVSINYLYLPGGVGGDAGSVCCCWERQWRF